VAALLIASGRARTSAAVRAALRAGARDIGEPGPDREYGAGLVQAPRAALAARPSATAVPSPSSRSDDRQASRSSVPWWLIAAGAALLASCARLLLLLARRRAT
jgi:hypothetical protein